MDNWNRVNMPKIIRDNRETSIKHIEHGKCCTWDMPFLCDSFFLFSLSNLKREKPKIGSTNHAHHVVQHKELVHNVVFKWWYSGPIHLKSVKYHSSVITFLPLKKQSPKCNENLLPDQTDQTKKKPSTFFLVLLMLNAFFFVVVQWNVKHK